MKIVEEEKQGILILSVEGRVAGDDSLYFARTISTITEKPKVIIELSEMSMMDTSDLSVLVSVLTTVQKKGGRLVLAGLVEGSQNLIAITKLTRIFDTYETLNEALASFK